MPSIDVPFSEVKGCHPDDAKRSGGEEGSRRSSRYKSVSTFHPGTLALCGLWLAITTAVNAPAQLSPPPPPPPPPPPAKVDLPLPPLPPGNRPVLQPAFAVVIDAAHGGTNTGARLSQNLLEKDITLAFASRLRAALAAHNITVVTTRDSDEDIPLNRRAGVANHAGAAACLVVHATATGSGVHLFTSSLAPSSAATPMVPWQSAQAGWLTRSLRLSSEINSTLGRAGIPTTVAVASVQPLDNLFCPALAIEIAPLAASAANKPLPISDPGYQQRILDALVSALLEWNADWKQQP